MKTVLFIPGFQESLDSRNYTALLKAIEAKGYVVKFVPISWSRTTIADWVKEFGKIYKDHDPSQTVLAGFSYGAMTAFVAAAECLPAELWLFSLSPYFAEDMPKLKKWWLSEIGKRRTEEFRKLSIRQLASTISCPTHILYGEKEGWSIIKDRAIEAHGLISRSTLTEVPGAGHDVADLEYIDSITEII